MYHGKADLMMIEIYKWETEKNKLKARVLFKKWLVWIANRQINDIYWGYKIQRLKSLNSDVLS